MLQVKMIFRLFYFYTSLFFPNQVNFSQPRLICFNLGQFGAGEKVTKLCLTLLTFAGNKLVSFISSVLCCIS